MTFCWILKTFHLFVSTNLHYLYFSSLVCFAVFFMQTCHNKFNKEIVKVISKSGILPTGCLSHAVAVLSKIKRQKPVSYNIHAKNIWNMMLLVSNSSIIHSSSQLDIWKACTVNTVISMFIDFIWYKLPTRKMSSFGFSILKHEELKMS